MAAESILEHVDLSWDDNQLDEVDRALQGMGVGHAEILRVLGHIRDSGTALARGYNQKTRKGFSVIRTMEGSFDVLEDRQHGEEAA